MEIRERLAPTLVAAAVLAAVVAAANPAEAGGTHFVLQLQGGFASSSADDMGPSFGYGVVVGAGGRLHHTTLRFYGLLAFDRASFSGSAVHPTGQVWDSSRSYNDFQVGLRFLVPIWWRLRWYVELMVGGSYLTGELVRVGYDSFQTNDFALLLSGTTGFEVRYFHHFATGIRAEFRWLPTGGEVLPTMVGQDRAADYRITVLATQSFLF